MAVHLRRGGVITITMIVTIVIVIAEGGGGIGDDLVPILRDTTIADVKVAGGGTAVEATEAMTIGRIITTIAEVTVADIAVEAADHRRRIGERRTLRSGMRTNRCFVSSCGRGNWKRRRRRNQSKREMTMMPLPKEMMMMRPWRIWLTKTTTWMGTIPPIPETVRKRYQKKPNLYSKVTRLNPLLTPNIIPSTVSTTYAPSSTTTSTIPGSALDSPPSKPIGRLKKKRRVPALRLSNSRMKSCRAWTI
mmetsp:Transcript_23332/g.48800  ORF Transcript_23332/g.48800 Transcript_23332/m.48800 type:complete len:248 (+) Transcript_23332:332-1075(+)